MVTLSSPQSPRSTSSPYRCSTRLRLSRHWPIPSDEEVTDSPRRSSAPAPDAMPGNRTPFDRKKLIQEVYKYRWWKKVSPQSQASTP
jgi:hypothetical protein